MTIRLLRGDCRETLAGLKSGSVQTCITSPPYYGLRSYGTPDLIWDGWVGSLGLEPTPELFVEHVVECFRAVRRVLRDDGTLWVNMGDSYAGSGKGPTGHNGIGGPGTQERRQGFNAGYEMANGEMSRGGRKSKTDAPAGYKAKDLLMMPARVAMALQADGWYLRSMIPWLKRNAMPESVTDRPATSVEYVFLFSKQARYFWDADAVRVANTPETTRTSRYRLDLSNGKGVDTSRGDGATLDRFASANGRNRRNGDWFFESWQGMLLDDEDVPLALVVNPAPLKIAHYASFPPKLVEPMVKASTSEKGCCAECGAPWARVTTVDGETARDKLEKRGASAYANGQPRNAQGLDYAGGHGANSRERATTGWRPTCACADPQIEACTYPCEKQLMEIGHCHCSVYGAPPFTVVPQTILDPFAGSGTTLMVADRLGRNAIGCELSESYSDMGTERVVGDAPMFVELESA